MNVTAWASDLEVTGDGTGIVSHAGLGLVRHLADKTGLTEGLSQALFSGRLLHHDRGRVLADISCAIADGARAVSDFRVLADQAEAFGQVASVPTAYRTLEEITRGGARMEQKLTAAISAARRYAWAQVVARHGALPGVRVADKSLQGVTCIRLDATVTPAHSEKELAEGNFKGFGHYPLLAFCDNTGGEPLAWMLRKGSAGSNTAADHIGLVDASVAALPPAWRRNLMVTTVICGSNKFSLRFRRSELSRTRPRRWLEGACERLVALLGGLAVFVAEPGGDLLPGGSCGAGLGDELVLAEVEFAALGGDGAEGGQRPAGGRGPGGRQRDVDIEQRDGIERVSAGGFGHEVSCYSGSWPAVRRRRRMRFSPWAASSSRRSRVISSR